MRYTDRGIEIGLEGAAATHRRKDLTFKFMTKRGATSQRAASDRGWPPGAERVRPQEAEMKR